MAVTNIKWCDIVIRCVDPHQLHVERIFRDRELWDSVMFPKLEAFSSGHCYPNLQCQDITSIQEYEDLEKAG
jgi:hypothetical protein